MSHLRAPGLGPIVGHVTHESCRLWIRADPKLDTNNNLDFNRRTIGVLRVVEEGGKPVKDDWTYYFRLHREFDRTGSFNLGKDPRPEKNAKKPRPLKANTVYTVRMGTLTLDDPLRDTPMESETIFDERLPSPATWKDDLENLPAHKSEATFQTFASPQKVGDEVDFLLGSCRYPGLLWKTRHSDRIFAPMADQVVSRTSGRRRSNSPHFLLMVGDQIYADMFNRFLPVGRADTYEEFRDRYIEAFRSSNLRHLMRNLPTYMILDDHEIEDNWAQNRLRRDGKHTLFTIAIDAYLSYQWSHGPRSYGKRLYYNFDCNGYPFFVLDTRTQRYLEGEKGELSKNHLLGRPTLPGAPPGQLKRLLNWLTEQQETRGNVPKFIVSPSVFVPSPMSARTELNDSVAKEESDSWPGFPKTKAAILNHIVSNDIQNVVFLSGDIHCANVAELRFKGSKAAEKLRSYSITSSAFYWPFPFADGEPSDFVHNSNRKGQGDTFTWQDAGANWSMDYRAWNFTQNDNYCRVSVDRKSNAIRVRAFDREGEIIREEIDSGKTNTLSAKLTLARW